MKQTIKIINMSAILAGAVLTFTGCAGDRYHQSTGELIDDKSVTVRVKKALGDDQQYKYPMVEVNTFKGTAQLSGFVNTRDQKSRASDLAKNVEGVRNVENNITVKE